MSPPPQSLWQTEWPKGCVEVLSTSRYPVPHYVPFPFLFPFLFPAPYIHFRVTEVGAPLQFG